jgi:ribosomal protein S15
LEEERQKSLGDPVIGDNTPFKESLLKNHKAGGVFPVEGSETNKRLNYFVTTEELEAALKYSKSLTKPVNREGAADFDPEKAQEAAQRHEEEHENAREAIERIMKLSNGSGADRARVNIQRCIEEFGRHNTDAVLPPKPPSAQQIALNQVVADTRRAGPDTGSSEVQVAILTSKILVLADQLKTTSHKDKHNKRNMRLLVHRRQKLLRYLRRKERGGPRWQNLVEKLGLADAAWKAEIHM